MDLKTRISHLTLSLYYAQKRAGFLKASHRLEESQRARLRGILQDLQGTSSWGHLTPDTSYEEFCREIPVRDYADYLGPLEEQKKTGSSILSPSVSRWEPTSGSTHSRKWIPYTSAHLKQMNAAAAVWLGELYCQYPSLIGGKHYWSLSWLPENLRALTTTDDNELFPPYQRWLLRNTMLMPPAVSTLPTIEQSRRATALLLLGDANLRFIFVWSPTFYLQILKYMTDHWTQLKYLLKIGQWGDSTLHGLLGKAPRRDLSGINSGNWRKIWPNLSLVSAWDSSSSQIWAEKLKDQLPHAQFQGKGLWATEGVVTIPIQDRKVLAFQSHFYEFLHIGTNEIKPSWHVQEGEYYQPIISSSNGFLRYRLSDQLHCSGFLNQVPCFEFIGRIHSVDMVGEKISVDFVQNMFRSLRNHEPVCLMACRSPRPHYVLLCARPGQFDLDSRLSQLHHYRLARELGQLGEGRVVYHKDPITLLSRVRKHRAEGQLKMDVLCEIENFPSGSDNPDLGNMVVY